MRISANFGKGQACISIKACDESFDDSAELLQSVCRNLLL